MQFNEYSEFEYRNVFVIYFFSNYRVYRFEIQTIFSNWSLIQNWIYSKNFENKFQFFVNATSHDRNVYCWFRTFFEFQIENLIFVLYRRKRFKNHDSINSQKHVVVWFFFSNFCSIIARKFSTYFFKTFLLRYKKLKKLIW